MLCRFKKFLAKSLLPSNCAAFCFGPITLTPLRIGSEIIKSCIPLTRGSSGPTTTNCILCCTIAPLTKSKSVGEISRFSATKLVPELPGATNRLSQLLLLEISSAKQCSLPPEPKISTFILICLFLSC